MFPFFAVDGIVQHTLMFPFFRCRWHCATLKYFHFRCRWYCAGYFNISIFAVGGIAQDTLMATQVTPWSRENCEKIYSTTVLTKSLMCIGNTTAELHPLYQVQYSQIDYPQFFCHIKGLPWYWSVLRQCHWKTIFKVWCKALPLKDCYLLPYSIIAKSARGTWESCLWPGSSRNNW